MVDTTCREILDRFSSVWQVDHPFVEPFEGGFLWWPGHHQVTVRCDKRVDPDNAEAWRVTVTTEVIRGVDLTDPKAKGLIATACRIAPTYCWVYALPELAEKSETPSDGKIRFHSSFYMRPETVSWAPEFFARLAIMQPIDAQRFGLSELVNMLGGEADLSGPRVAAQDGTVDDILNVAQEVFVPLGKETSRWEGIEEFAEIAAQWGRSDMCFGNGGPEGLTLETPFGELSALVRLRPDVRHPALGAGLLSSLQLPAFDTLEGTTDTCMWLNFFSSISWTDAPVLASWHPQEVPNGQYCPAFGVHIPNALFAPRLATNLALWNIASARWAQQALWPHLTNLPMDEILAARFGAPKAT